MIKYCVLRRYENLFDFGHNKYRFTRTRPVKVIKNAAKTSPIYSFENYRNISSIRFKQSKKKIMWYHKLYCIDLFTLIVIPFVCLWCGWSLLSSLFTLYHHPNIVTSILWSSLLLSNKQSIPNPKSQSIRAHIFYNHYCFGLWYTPISIKCTMNYRTLTQISRIIYGRGRVHQQQHIWYAMDALHSLAIGYLSLFRNNVLRIRISAISIYFSLPCHASQPACIWEKPLLH